MELSFSITNKYVYSFKPESISYINKHFVYFLLACGMSSSMIGLAFYPCKSPPGMTYYFKKFSSFTCVCVCVNTLVINFKSLIVYWYHIVERKTLLPLEFFNQQRVQIWIIYIMFPCLLFFVFSLCGLEYLASWKLSVSVCSWQRVSFFLFPLNNIDTLCGKRMRCFRERNSRII